MNIKHAIHQAPIRRPKPLKPVNQGRPVRPGRGIQGVKAQFGKRAFR